MNVKKPYIPIFIIHSFVQLQQLMETGKDFNIALQVDFCEIEIDKKLIKLLIEGEISFMLLIGNKGQVNNAIAPGIMELINLCVFSKNYIRSNHAPVVSFIKNDQAFSNLFIANIQKQGWPAIAEWILPVNKLFAEQIHENDAMPLWLSNIDFDETFLLHHFFTNSCNIGKYIFFQETAMHSAIAIEEIFFRLNLASINSNPLLRLYLNSYSVTKQKVGEVLNENKILIERLENARQTIDIIQTKYKGDYDKLFYWYQKEYEVLPLWYKKIGHILKAIMGKRTFKSLLNDDEKKEYLRRNI